MISVTRRYRFSASHRLNSSILSPDENSRLYGKCNNPFGHGHDYALEVTARGQVDPHTGLLMAIPQLDRLVNERILGLFAYRNLNADLDVFTTMVPTAENIAIVITGLLKQHWTSYFGNHSASLKRVNIQETERNGFEVITLAPNGRRSMPKQPEGTTVNA